MSKLEVKLLPHQYELLADTSTKIIGLVSGYGAGKTYAAVRKALQLAFLNPGCAGVITEPTYPLLQTRSSNGVCRINLINQARYLLWT